MLPSIKKKLKLVEKISMKSTIKFALVIVLFCSTAFADGEMSNGGKTCTTNCFVGGQTNTTVINDNNVDKSENYLLTFVKDFLNEIFR
jgi:hypothetical protein